MKQNQDVYNRIAKHFSDTRSWVTDDLVELGVYAKAGDKILDLACGNARLYQLFVEQKRENEIKYTGVDFTENLLEMARRRFSGINVKFGEMTQIPCTDQGFDIVYCLASFHHLATDEERLQAFREITRVLKFGGKLVMTNWNIYSDWAKEKLSSGKWREGDLKNEIIVPWKDAEGKVIGERLYYAYTQEEIELWCLTVGLKIVKQYYAVKKGDGKKSEGMNIVTIAMRQ